MRYFLKGCLCATALALLSSVAVAAEKPVREQKALDALTAMGAYLQTLQQFEVSADSTVDRVSKEAGITQLVQFSHTARVLVKRPDHLQADFSGIVAGSSKHAYYEGKHFTLYSQPSGYYATVDAPPTLKQLGEQLEGKYGIELPLGDLFSLGVDATALKRVIAAAYIGEESIGEKTCAHYIYHQKDIDWQLWVQQGDTPLPCKINIVTLTDKARPQYTAVYNWQLSPTVTAQSFEFVPSSEAKKIEIRRLGK